jgi:hypothetical protein
LRSSTEHIDQTTGRTVEEVASALEAITGDLTDGKYQRDVGSASTKEDFEARVERFQSDSGFMRFLAWLRSLASTEATTIFSLLSRSFDGLQIRRHGICDTKQARIVQQFAVLHALSLSC